MDRRTLEFLYDLRQWMLRPDYQRLADTHRIKRNPVTDEISWPPSSLVDDLRKAGLL